MSKPWLHRVEGWGILHQHFKFSESLLFSCKLRATPQGRWEERHPEPALANDGKRGTHRLRAHTERTPGNDTHLRAAEELLMMHSEAQGKAAPGSTATDTGAGASAWPVALQAWLAYPRNPPPVRPGEAPGFVSRNSRACCRPGAGICIFNKLPR